MIEKPSINHLTVPHKLNQSDVINALKISKIIQKRIDHTGETNLRSTDVFPDLVKAGLYEPDKHNGVHFRRFLNRVSKAGELKSLIPQCSQVPPINDEVFSEWYFHSAKSKVSTQMGITSERRTLKHNPVLDSKYKINLDLEEAIEIVTKLIKNINPITQKAYDDLGVCAEDTVKEALKTLVDIRVPNKKKKPSFKSKDKKALIKKYIKRTGNKINNDSFLQEKFYSTTALGKLKNKTYSEVIKIMIANELILSKNEITYKGQAKGIKFKQNGKGDKWIVYPESLAELI